MRPPSYMLVYKPIKIVITSHNQLNTNIHQMMFVNLAIVNQYPMTSHKKSAYFSCSSSIFLWFSYGFPMVFLVFLWFSYGFSQQSPASPFELPASGTAQGGFAVPLRALRALRAGATGPGVELGQNGGSGWCWYILMVNVKCIKY